MLDLIQSINIYKKVDIDVLKEKILLLFVSIYIYNIVDHKKNEYDSW